MPEVVYESGMLVTFKGEKYAINYLFCGMGWPEHVASAGDAGVVRYINGEFVCVESLSTRRIAACYSHEIESREYVVLYDIGRGKWTSNLL